MFDDLPEDLTTLSDEDLDSFLTQADEALEAAIAAVPKGETPTDEQFDAAETANETLAALRAERERRDAEAAEAEQAAAARAERFASLRQARQPEQPEPAAEPEPEPEPVTASAPQPRRSTVQAASAVTPRPEVPDNQPRATIVAAADSGFTTGSEIDLHAVGVAALTKMRGFPEPDYAANQRRADLGTLRPRMDNYPVAAVRKPFQDDMVADGRNDMEVLLHAADESRLPQGSLVAAGGWCAPSETIYDLPGVTGTAGLLDLPEINVRRGGIRFTRGIDYATIYTNTGFAQTEAQAIAGTTKPCYDVTCPDFEEVRLDAVGLCIRIPLLTQAGWPELVDNVVANALVAHQHRMSARLLTAMAADSTAVTGIDLGSGAGSTLGAIELAVESIRYRYRLEQNATVEGVAPHWLLGAIRGDLAMRTGVDMLTVTDQQINAHFAARGARIQWVYNWQDLAVNPASYPATANILLYPAGTFVKGTADVITLGAVYDHASLIVNMYTGLFTEEGLLLARLQYDAVNLTVPVDLAGITGAATNTADGNSAV